MVKTIIKSYASRVCGTKRVRGLKSRIKSNNSTKKVKNNSRKIQAKPFDMNYYSQPKINFLLSQEDNTITRLLKKESLEFSEIKPDVTPKYKQEHRAVALIGLKDIIYQVYELCKGKLISNISYNTTCPHGHEICYIFAANCGNENGYLKIFQIQNESINDL